MRTRVIETFSDGFSYAAVQERDFPWGWITLRLFPIHEKEKAIEMARKLSNPPVLFDSEQEASK